MRKKLGVTLVLIFSALTSSQAVASDMSGIISILWGLPVMAFAAIVYGGLAAIRVLHGILYSVATLLFVPLFLFGLIMAADAASNFGQDRTILYGIGYYALFITFVLCFAILNWRYWTRYITIGRR
jgi:hypothetical protein